MAEKKVPIPLSGSPAPSGIGGIPVASGQVGMQLTASVVRSSQFPVVRPGFNQEGDLFDGTHRQVRAQQPVVSMWLAPGSG